MSEKVVVREERVLIPTYGVSEPDKNPLFLERRVYQGSSGKVYPFPVTEKILDEKKDKEYKAVFIENEYILVMILPELGGRIQRLYDKTSGTDVVYYNHVVKPALVGLTGPWISGGIEFNWPQHHRPSTFLPVQYRIQSNDDGSKTVWCSETDRMYGTKGMAGFTVYPGKTYLEIKGQVYNGTDLPQTFLWWANPAVPVNDYTRTVFPADVNAVMDHGKRAVSTFPIATGEYYKADYSAGVDISRYKNIPVPTSFMAHRSDYDFIGNYDEQKEMGLLHVADHHVSPGKKQWTWGNGDFGRAWDRNLTDEDGPYIEMMTGVFADNQPDFTWLKPHEEKTFVQYFMPYRKAGYIKNATEKACLNIEQESDGLKVTVCSSAVYEDCGVFVIEPSASGSEADGCGADLMASPGVGADSACSGAARFCAGADSAKPATASRSKLVAKVSLRPESPVVLKLDGVRAVPGLRIEVRLEAGALAGRAPQSDAPVMAGRECLGAEAYAAPGEFVTNCPDASVSGACAPQSDANVLVAYTIPEDRVKPIPSPADPLPAPEKLRSTEELLLAGEHLEQYRHATFEPEAYYLEGLKRDDGDMRLNNAYGLLLLRRGLFAESEPYFRRAIKRQTWLTANPYYGEYYFNLGLSLFMQGKKSAAYDAFFKATWSAETQASGFYFLSCIKAGEGLYKEALTHVEKSLAVNFHDMKARTLKAALLRRLGDVGEGIASAGSNGVADASLGANSGVAGVADVTGANSGVTLKTTEEMSAFLTAERQFLEESQRIDPICPGIIYEKMLFEKKTGEVCKGVFTDDAAAAFAGLSLNDCLNLSIDYMKAGFYDDAEKILAGKENFSPLVLYYLAWIAGKNSISGRDEKVRELLCKAESACPDWCFPNKLEEVCILEYAIKQRPDACMAPYYLGNLFYDRKQYDKACELWLAANKNRATAATTGANADKSAQNATIATNVTKSGSAINSVSGTLCRNLAMYYYNKKNDNKTALSYMSEAVKLSPADSRIIMEYDSLSDLCGTSPEKRLEFLESRLSVVRERDALYTEYITLLNSVGRYEDALACIKGHTFHPWEGGEGKASTQFVFSLTELGRKKLAEGNGSAALSLFTEALTYPENMGEGKLPGTQDTILFYYAGCAESLMGNADKAAEWWQKASVGLAEPSRRLYYNDQPSDTIFYQGLACLKLDKPEEAKRRFHKLMRYGEQHYFDETGFDYFAVSLPDTGIFHADADKTAKTDCLYLQALGNIGMGLFDSGNLKKAKSCLNAALEMQPSNQGVIRHIRLLSEIQNGEFSGAKSAAEAD